MDDSITIVLDSREVLSGVCGANDGNLKVIEGSLGGRIAARGNEIRFEGVDENGVRRFKIMMDSLIAAVREGENPSPDYVRALAGIRGPSGSRTGVFAGSRTVQSPAGDTPGEAAQPAAYSAEAAQSADEHPADEHPADEHPTDANPTDANPTDINPMDPLREAQIRIPQGFCKVFPRGRNQAAYIQGMRTHDICFCVGPAGTGKTYLAIAEALKLVLSKKMRKLVLTRPVVEAGESLGFLPGDLSQKINPYLRPLYDAMEALIPYELIRRMEENRTIEIAPLAYMRGRSLNDSVIILDEAQNTTREQMKMFLTRIGEGSKAVITGDATQIDLPKRFDSGLLHAVSILSNVEGLYFAYLHTADVVRNSLIKKIIQAYDAEPSKDRAKGFDGAGERSPGTYNNEKKR
ncbi:MAG: PhoH family protein [Spirochaetaceae bacterium]|nr:PhoH family protein [Spirochaetaceae bacterium]